MRAIWGNQLSEGYFCSAPTPVTGQVVCCPSDFSNILNFLLDSDGHCLQNYLIQNSKEFREEFRVVLWAYLQRHCSDGDSWVSTCNSEGSWRVGSFSQRCGSMLAGSGFAVAAIAPGQCGVLLFLISLPPQPPSIPHPCAKKNWGWQKTSLFKLLIALIGFKKQPPEAIRYLMKMADPDVMCCQLWVRKPQLVGVHVCPILAGTPCTGAEGPGSQIRWVCPPLGKAESCHVPHVSLGCFMEMVC